MKPFEQSKRSYAVASSGFADHTVPEVPLACSAAGDESDDDVGGVAVEVLSSPVVDRGGSWVGVSCGELHVAHLLLRVNQALMIDVALLLDLATKGRIASAEEVDPGAR